MNFITKTLNENKAFLSPKKKTETKIKHFKVFDFHYLKYIVIVKMGSLESPIEGIGFLI